MYTRKGIADAEVAELTLILLGLGTVSTRPVFWDSVRIRIILLANDKSAICEMFGNILQMFLGSGETT